MRSVSACRFYGYTEDAICKMSLSDLSTLPPGELSNRMRLAENKQKNFFSTIHRLADKETRDVQIFIAPINYKDRVLLFGIVQDITEANKTKRMLAESELRQDRILGSLSEGIFAVDQYDKITYVNQRVSDLLGLPYDKVVGSHPLDHVSEESKAEVIANLAIRRKGVGGSVDYKLKRANGSEFWATLSAKPICSNCRFRGDHLCDHRHHRAKGNGAHAQNERSKVPPDR